MPRWNPIESLTALVALLALIALAALAAPVAEPLLAAALTTLALWPLRRPRYAAMLAWALALLALLVLLALVLLGWPWLLEQAVQAGRRLSVVTDTGGLANLLLSQNGHWILALPFWAVLFPAGLILSWLGGADLARLCERRWPASEALRRAWAQRLGETLRVLAVQLVGRLVVYGAVLALLGSDYWALLALLAAVAALIPGLPLILPLGLLLLTGVEPTSVLTLLVFVGLEAGFYGLLRRRPSPLPMLWCGLAMLVGAAALGPVGLLLALPLLALVAVLLTAPAPLAPAVTTVADDPLPEAVDESMRQEDS